MESTLDQNPELLPIASRGIRKKTKAKALKTTSLTGKPLGRRVEFQRFFTQAGVDPFETVSYIKSTSKIKDTDGRTVFEMKDVEVPASWTQLAIDILVSKYFRKAGVPQTEHEVSVRQVIRR